MFCFVPCILSLSRHQPRILPILTEFFGDDGTKLPIAMRRTEKLKTKVMLNPTLSPEDGGRIKTNPVSKLKHINGRTIVAIAVNHRLDKTILKRNEK